MTRMTSAFALGALLVAGPALAQTTPKPASTTPPAQTPAPPAQTPAAPAAQTPAPTPPVPFPAGAKVAVVNFQQVASESKAGKAASTQLAQLRDKQSTALQKQNDQLKALQDKQKSASLMSEAAAAQVQKDIDQLQMDIQYAQQKNQKEAEDMNQELMNAFYNKVIPVVKAIATEKGIQVVLSVQDAGIAYWEPGLDLSEEVVKRLDAAAPATGGGGH